MTQENKIQDLCQQIRLAKQLDYVRDVEILSSYEHPVLLHPCDTVQKHSPDMPLPEQTKRVYVKFSPDVSLEKIKKIKEHIQSKYGFHCSVCEWSVPLRLDIYLK